MALWDAARKRRAALLGLELVDPPAAFLRGVQRGRRFPGKSSERAGLYVARSGGERRRAVRLVHGRLIDPDTGRPAAHGWVEVHVGAVLVVFDGADSDFYDGASYFAALGAERADVYTAADAGRLVLLTEHYGPWTAGELRAARRQG